MIALCRLAGGRYRRMVKATTMKSIEGKGHVALQSRRPFTGLEALHYCTCMSVDGRRCQLAALYYSRKDISSKTHSDISYLVKIRKRLVLGDSLKLTCHMVAAIILLNIPRTSRPGTLFCQLPDSLETRLFLSSLISLLTTRTSVLKLLTRLPLVPCIFMENTHFVSAVCTREDVTLHATQVDLTRVAGSTPPEVCYSWSAHY